MSTRPTYSVFGVFGFLGLNSSRLRKQSPCAYVVLILQGSLLVQILTLRSAFKLALTSSYFVDNLQSHRQVSCRMSSRFSNWLSRSWEPANVDAPAKASFSDWLQGRTEGLKPGLMTVSHQVTASTKMPPYHDYTKYNVVSNGSGHLETVTSTSSSVGNAGSVTEQTVERTNV